VPLPRVEGAASLHLTSTSEDFYMRTHVRTYFIKNHENVWRIPQKALSLHVMRQKTFQTRYVSYVLLALTCLLTACSGGGSSSEELDPPTPNPTPSPTPENQEIKLNANVWNMMEGMRASTYDNVEALQNAGFKTYVYVDGETTKYIDGSTVSYADSQWSFDDGKHYWPASGSLNFFAHSPKDLANTHCTFDSTPYDASENPDGYSEDSPRIVCSSLPVAFTKKTDDTKELIYAYTANQNKAGQGVSGVMMTFKHPFALIKFQLASSHPNITINSITFKAVKNNGSCIFDGTGTTWTLTGDAANLVASYSPGVSFSTSSEVQLIGGPFLVIPQSWAGEIEVNASWTEWGEEKNKQTLSATVPTDWDPGYSYTYTFTITKFDLIVNISKFTEQW